MYSGRITSTPHAVLTSAAITGGTLPFTGAAVVWVLVSGLILLAAGIALLSMFPKREK